MRHSSTRPRRFSSSTLTLVALASALTFGTASVAAAQARVAVEVRTAAGGAVDGRVTLTSKSGGRTFSCTARAGRCHIDGVPGGVYVARLELASGEAPPPREVMIPPSGEVALHIAAR